MARVRVGVEDGVRVKEVFAFDSKSENRDRAFEAVESVRGESSLDAAEVRARWG